MIITRDNLRLLRCRVLLPALALALCGAIGCGPSMTPPAPAAGAASYRGKPIEQGRVLFVPEAEGGEPAGGTIKDGKFVLTTREAGDGAIPGRYKVGVISIAEVPVKEGQEPEYKSLIPSKFGNAEESGITREIPPEGDMDISLNID